VITTMIPLQSDAVRFP